MEGSIALLNGNPPAGS